jgi:hypothetical protein
VGAAALGELDWSTAREVQVDVYLLLVFLCLQSYHRPSARMAGDVWPSGPTDAPPSPSAGGLNGEALSSPTKQSVSMTAARSKVRVSPWGLW